MTAGARATAACAAAVAVAGALASCGGGGGSTTDPNASVGERVFTDTGCGSCHTLKAADATGAVGQNLDAKRYSAATVERVVVVGGKGMPAYRDQLSAGEIRELAQFVARSSGGSAVP